MVDVSVIIPVFNGAATIGPAIDSVLAQTNPPEFEIVVINDGSTDSTCSVLAQYESHIHLLNQSNRGLAAARNAGARIAHGRHLAFLDADDIWLSDKLALTITSLESTTDAVLAYSDVIAVDSQSHPLALTLIPAQYAFAPSMADLLRNWWPILPSTVVVRRSGFEACGGFCEEFGRAYEDVDLWLRLRERGEFVYLPTPLVKYNTRPTSESMLRYEDDYPVFARRVLERYGTRAELLLNSTREAYVSALGHKGLLAIQAGEFLTARRYFLRAWRYERSSLRALLRFARTFLPASLAKTLSGRTRNAHQKAQTDRRTR
jgi:glycosyltransferase involved in cell wall biosynthesis